LQQHVVAVGAVAVAPELGPGPGSARELLSQCGYSGRSWSALFD